MNTILPKSAAWSGVCLAFISWASVARAGLVDESPAKVASSLNSMTGTTYGTIIGGGFIQCEILAEFFFTPPYGYCRGSDAGGMFDCQTDDPVLLRAIETIPDYGKLTVKKTGFTCKSISSVRGSLYLPPGVPTGAPEADVGPTNVHADFYGTRVSSDGKQYVRCAVHDSPTFSYTTCQAKDVEGDYFFCTSDEPRLISAARALTPYSYIELYKLTEESSDCEMIYSKKGTSFLPF